MSKLKLTSPKFSDGEEIPEKYGYKRKNVNPPLNIDGIPEEAESLVLIMDDPDAMKPAGKVWDHWVVWNIDTNTSVIEENEVPKGATEGKNDYGAKGYGGPNPPDGEHTYHFKLYALNKKLNLPSSSTKDDVRKAIKGNIIAKAKHTGTFTPL